MRTKGLIVTATALAVLVTACGPLGGGEEPPAPGKRPMKAPSSAPPQTSGDDKRPAIASAQVLANDKASKNVKADLVGLNRQNGNQLVAQIRLTNLDQEQGSGWSPWSEAANFMDRDSVVGPDAAASGIGVIDLENRRVLMTYKDGERCLCSSKEDSEKGYFLKPGQSRTLVAVLPAPEDAQRATVVTPFSVPFINAPISDDAPAPPPDGRLPDAGGASLQPITYGIETPSESLDKTEETRDDGKNIAVNLSSDVLFKVNKADLSPKARAILARTAKRIDDSPGPVVTIAGHADSSGNNKINDPLSKRRAESVRKALAKLVTRDGVRYTAKGYGSRRPLYPNTSDEGKRRNRRVTVTFAKPAVATNSSPDASTATPMESAKPGPTMERTIDGQPFTAAAKVTELGGGLGVLTYTISNKGSKDTWVHDLSISDDWQELAYHGNDDVELVDPAKRMRYPAARFTGAGDGKEKYCACTQAHGVHLGGNKVGAGQTKEFWSLVGVPSAAAVDVRLGEFRRMGQVAISR